MIVVKSLASLDIGSSGRSEEANILRWTSTSRYIRTGIRPVSHTIGTTEVIYEAERSGS